MIQRLGVLAACWMAGLGSLSAQAGDDTRVEFLARYCTACHGGEEAQADLRLDTLAFDLLDNEVRETWLDVEDYVSHGDMPPEEADAQPTTEERDAFLAALSRGLNDTAEGAYASVAPVRSLNRRELLYTVRDLFGIREIRLPGHYPDDHGEAHFDTMVAGAQVSTAQLEAGIEFATDIAERLVPLRRPEQRELRSSFRDLVLSGRLVDMGPDRSDYRFTGVNVSGWSGAIYDRSFVAHTSGVYRVRVRARAEGRQGADGRPLRLGFYALNPNDYQLPQRALRRELPRVAELEVENRILETKECLVPLEKGEAFHLYCENRFDSEPIDRPLSRGEQGDLVFAARASANPSVRLTRMEIFGPVAPLPRQATFQTPRATVVDEAYVDALLGPIAERAFRRPLAQDETDSLTAAVLAHIKATGSTERGLRYGLRRILCSPQFLYLNLDAAEHPDQALASRLSYFLWSSLPDDELTNAARTGALSDREALRRHASRMLSDPRSERFVESFAGQWLGNDDIADVMVCDVRHSWSELLRDGYQRATKSFFDEVLRENRSIRTFIDSDFTYATEPMRIAWGFPTTHDDWEALEAMQRESLAWPQPERLDLRTLPPEVPPEVALRGGVLGLPSVLLATGDGVESSPILRGVWILENLFGTPPPPPPSDVPALVADTSDTRTVRELLAVHQSVASCAKCHVSIDPLGLAMENFDAIGGWRTDYYADNPQPVEAWGVMPDGTELRGPADIKAYLLDRPQLFTRCLVTKLLEYSTGRELNARDEAVVEEILAAEPEGGYGFRDLLLEVVCSGAFTAN